MFGGKVGPGEDWLGRVGSLLGERVGSKGAESPGVGGSVSEEDELVVGDSVGTSFSVTMLGYKVGASVGCVSPVVGSEVEGVGLLVVIVGSGLLGLGS
jgi:hypothetical protein